MLWFAYFVGAPKVLSLKFPALKEQFISIMENSSQKFSNSPYIFSSLGSLMTFYLRCSLTLETTLNLIGSFVFTVF